MFYDFLVMRFISGLIDIAGLAYILSLHEHNYILPQLCFYYIQLSKIGSTFASSLIADFTKTKTHCVPLPHTESILR